MSRLRDLLPQLDAWGSGLRVGRAVVIRTMGSSPWPEGATLLVAEDGRMAGTVSGGCVEADAAGHVRHAIERGETRVVRYGVSDESAWSVGLACGGRIELLVEPVLRPAILHAARLSDGTALGIRLPGEEWTELGPLRRLPPSPGGSGARADVVAFDDGDYFVERFARAPRLVVFGAGEVTYRLTTLASAIGWEVVVVDARQGLLDPVRLQGASRVVAKWPEDADAEVGLGPDDVVAVLTHDPKLDDPALVLALGKACRYVGAIGSRKTQSERRRRLREAGVSEGALRRLHGPVGLDLGGREPGETALAILAEAVATVHEGTARPLSQV